MPARDLLSLALAAALTLGAACTKPNAAGDEKRRSGAAEQTAPAKTTTVSPSPDDPAPARPADQERASQPRQPKQPKLFAGAHILVAYKGANRAGPEITRTKQQAQARARELAARAGKDPAQFGKLAADNSDGPSAKRGGSLGVWPKGRMVPEFDNAIAKLEVNQVTKEPVETAFGYHVIIRLEPILAGAHILVAYKGAARASDEIKRSKDEARALAAKLAQKARKAPDSFAELAREHSDGPSGKSGGKLGKWPRGRMVPAFDQAIDGLEVNQISDPVETPFGFHVIKRLDPDSIS